MGKPSLASAAILLNDPSCTDVPAEQADALRSIARAWVTNHLNDPRSAQYADESARQSPDGSYVLCGAVDALGPTGQRIRHWYLIHLTPGDPAPFGDLLQYDPRQNHPAQTTG